MARAVVDVAARVGQVAQGLGRGAEVEVARRDQHGHRAGELVVGQYVQRAAVDQNVRGQYVVKSEARNRHAGTLIQVEFAGGDDGRSRVGVGAPAGERHRSGSRLGQADGASENCTDRTALHIISGGAGQDTATTGDAAALEAHACHGGVKVAQPQGTRSRDCDLCCTGQSIGYSHRQGAVGDAAVLQGKTTRLIGRQGRAKGDALAVEIDRNRARTRAGGDASRVIRRDTGAILKRAAAKVDVS